MEGGLGRAEGLLQLFLIVSIVMPVTQSVVKHGLNQYMQSFLQLYCYRYKRYSFLRGTTNHECALSILWDPFFFLISLPHASSAFSHLYIQGCIPKLLLLFDVLIVHCL